MPYIKRSVPQALDLVDAGVIDVYSSPNVYANNVPIALFEAPILGTAPWSNLNLPPDPPAPGYPSKAQTENMLASEALAQSNANPPTGVIWAGPNAGQTAATVQGEAPAVGTDDPNDLGGNPGATTTAVVPPTGESIQARIESFLSACIAQYPQWKESPKGTPTANINGLWQQLGLPQNINTSTPWCAAFVSVVLKNAGAPYVPRGTAALQYGPGPEGRWQCTRVPVTDPTQWRRNDVIQITWRSGGNHVAFIQGVDLKTDSFLMTGGNQGDDMTAIAQPGISQIRGVGRAWTIDPQFDKPIFMNLNPGQRVSTR